MLGATDLFDQPGRRHVELRRSRCDLSAEKFAGSEPPERRTAREFLAIAGEQTTAA